MTTGQTPQAPRSHHAGSPQGGAHYLRLRQICLVAPDLEPAVDAVRAIFGLEVCFRDPAVGKYGLVNALFVFGHQFLEVVAPTRDGTTAGRFIERSGGRGGYMVSLTPGRELQESVASMFEARGHKVIRATIGGPAAHG